MSILIADGGESGLGVWLMHYGSLLLELVIIALLIAILYKNYNGTGRGSSKSESNRSDLNTRQTLAMTMIVIALVGILGLSVLVLAAKFELESGKFVFGAVLPLLATWIGTVLAYYFSRENLAAATQSVATLADRLTPLDRLRSIPVKDKMRPIGKIVRHVVDPADDATTLLTTILADPFERHVILSKAGSLRYLIYTAIINKYISTFAVPAPAWPAGVTRVADLTLAHLVNSDNKVKDMFEKSWGVVQPTDTLADAKKVMDSTPPPCNDVFVTSNGKRDGAVEGWITDNTLAENSRV